MDCGSFRKFADLYLDRELDPESELECAQHLERCRACSGYLAYLKGQKARLKELYLHAALPPGLEARVRASLRREASPVRAFLGLAGWKNSAALAALILLVSLAGFVAWQALTQPEPGATLSVTALSGELICLGHELKKEHHADSDCEMYGHLPAIKTRDGTVWSLVNNAKAGALARAMTHEARRIQVTARVFPGQHYLDIQEYRFLN